MTIGIDGNEANNPHRVGIGAYAYAVVTGMAKHLSSDTKLTIYLKNPPLTDLPKRSEHIRYKIVGPKFLWTQIGLPFHLFTEKEKPDIFFSPTHYAPRFSPVPTAISVMDLSFLHFPETFARRDLTQLTQWTKYSVKKAHLIFTISEASKNDIIEAYRIPEERVVVTYPGVREIVSLRPNVYPTTMLKNNYGINGEYFLFVGTLQPRKNITRLIEAFSHLAEKENSKDVKLVIVGKKGWLYEDILKAPESFGVSESVIFLEFVKDEDLPVLYKHAIAYVLPSLYEGFGLPVLEAMNYDCPVITSNVSSLPEAGGDAALYVNPEDVEDIASQMKKLLEDKELRKKLIEKGHEQVKKFSWDKTAKETLSALEKLAHTS